MSERQRRDDLYEVTLRPHDERVEVGGWTYYVRGVTQEDELLPRVPIVGELLFDGPRLAARGIKRLVSRRDAWAVAVVRLGSVKTWNDVKPVVVHKEPLPEGNDAGERIGELVEEVKAERFAPTAR